jgi:hypothetical protein
MATVNVHLGGSESVSGAAEKASKSLRDLRKNVEDQVQPMKDLGRSMREVMELGGMALIFREVARGITEAQRAYEKLHPEVAKSAGSLTQFTVAMEEMKASVGAAVGSVLSPLRAALVNMADPTLIMKNNIKGLGDEIDTLAKKYQTLSATQLLIMDQLKAANLVTEALTSRNEAYSRVNEAAESLQKQKASQAAIMSPGMAAVGGGIAAIGGAIQISQTEGELTRLQSLYLIAQKNLDEAQKTLKEITERINNPGAGGGGRGGAPVASVKAGRYLDDIFGQDQLGVAGAMRFKGGYRTGTELSAGELFILSRLDEIAGLTSSNNVLNAGGGGTGSWYPGKGAAGYTKGEETPNPTGGMRFSMNGTPDFAAARMEQFFGVLGQIGSAIGSAFGSVASTVASLKGVMDPLVVVFTSMFSTLGPVLNQVLAPVIGAFAVLGTALAQILTPIVQALSPVITFLAEGFVWLYNNCIVPAGNALSAFATSIINTFVNIGTLVDNMIHGRWGNLGQGMVGTDIATLYANGPLKAISQDALGEAGRSYMGTDSGGNSTGYSSSTTVEQAAPIYVYLTINGSVFGSGGPEEVGRELAEALKRYANVGGRIEILGMS